MVRNFFIVGAVVVASASIPVFLDANPEALDKLVGGMNETGEVTEVIVPVTHAKPEAKKLGGTTELTGRRVRISMDPKGHFSGDFKLNGRRVSSLIDTGATLVAINKSTARRIGLNLQPADFKYQVNTANGAAKAAAAKIDRLQIGRIYVENVEAVVLDDNALDNTLIGMSFLNRLNKFRVENSVLYLEQ